MPLRFEKITTHKKRFLDLLLLADEQESMIDRYLEPVSYTHPSPRD